MQQPPEQIHQLLKRPELLIKRRLERRQLKLTQLVLIQLHLRLQPRLPLRRQLILLPRLLQRRRLISLQRLRPRLPLRLRLRRQLRARNLLRLLRPSETPTFMRGKESLEGFSIHLRENRSYKTTIYGFLNWIDNNLPQRGQAERFLLWLCELWQSWYLHSPKEGECLVCERFRQASELY